MPDVCWVGVAGGGGTPADQAGPRVGQGRVDRLVLYQEFMCFGQGRVRGGAGPRTALPEAVARSGRAWSSIENSTASNQWLGGRGGIPWAPPRPTASPLLALSPSPLLKRTGPAAGRSRRGEPGPAGAPVVERVGHPPDAAAPGWLGCLPAGRPGGVGKLCQPLTITAERTIAIVAVINKQVWVQGAHYGEVHFPGFSTREQCVPERPAAPRSSRRPALG